MKSVPTTNQIPKTNQYSNWAKFQKRTNIQTELNSQNEPLLTRGNQPDEAWFEICCREYQMKARFPGLKYKAKTWKGKLRQIQNNYDISLQNNFSKDAFFLKDSSSFSWI